MLLVDDEPHIRSVLRRMIGIITEGVHVDDVDSADAALAQLKLAQYDLVLSDLKMPGRPGTDVLAALRTEQPDCFRALASGHNEFLVEVNQAQLTAASPNATLNKPLVLEELERVLEAAGLPVKTRASAIMAEGNPDGDLGIE